MATFHSRLVALVNLKTYDNIELEYQNLLNSSMYSTSDNDPALKYHVAFLKTWIGKKLRFRGIPKLRERYKTVSEYIATFARIHDALKNVASNNILALIYSYPFRVENHRTYNDYIAFCTNIESTCPVMKHTSGSLSLEYHIDNLISYHSSK